MMKNKEKSSKGQTFAKGGSAKMSGKNYVGPQTPGQATSGGQPSNAPVARGGGKAMAGFSGAAPAVGGQVSTGGRGGNSKFEPDRGGKAMAGYTGSQAAKGC
jgi:hypothetical protein